MATRRKKKTWDAVLWELLVGKPSKGKRSSSGRRKSGAHPLNVKRRYSRWAATVDTNRASSLKEKNDLAAKRAAALLARDREKARAKAAREKRRLEAGKAKKARIDAAQARRTQQTQPTTRTIPAQPRVRVRPSTPTEAVLCGARTDDGTPCQNPTTGGPCSAGHNPKAKSRPRTRTTKASGDQYATDANVVLNLLNGHG